MGKGPCTGKIFFSAIKKVFSYLLPPTYGTDVNLTSDDSMMLHAKTAEEENFNWVADQIKAMGHKRKKY